MNEESLQAAIARHTAEGFEIVQQGRVIRGHEHGIAFAERVEGFDIQLLGSYRPPTYQSEYDNRLLDTPDRWVHLRRRKESL